eukprot:CAMPEP_0202857142 /NCGR_PEP_ID=MMETSP1391-20130828/193_1 /ASSEMBLY_ACC=CAM_ASM_000867 /TAXON_ID=1034604 /ORGANISM="Chlamydomonas leiostraca, Strain SAG 11-49" /LENGTH=415 /DNA_ID=CAMNT_0049535905 /DNA_START=63 /DNA_END=1310 /DNA_ORIENTATION=+
MQLQRTAGSRVAARRAAAGKRAVVVRTATPSAPSTTKPSKWLEGLQFMNPAWSKVENEQQFTAVVKGAMAKMPNGDKLVPLWVDFFQNYNKAITTSDQEGASEHLAAKIQAMIADAVTNQFIKPYTFPSFHERITGPDYDYFAFGQRYVGSLTDFNNSVLGHKDRWDQIQAYIDAGHNVVLLANHQTEADPGVFAHMLMASHPKLATDVIYVAGDRVVTDPLCKPFSMGRNLFCVHSKKHLDDVPELKASKMETNRKTLVAMQRALNKGGVLMWIAPSGGRDRPKADGTWSPDPFDPSAVELMRNLATRAKQPGHLFPMAMYSWPMMPPPKTVDKSIGERRLTYYTPVGITVAPELDLTAHDAAHTGTGDAAAAAKQSALAKQAETACINEYKALEAAIMDPSKRGTAFTQPWKK